MQKKATDIIKKWQRKLYLNDWDVSIEFINKKDNKFKSKTDVAYMQYDTCRKEADISVVLDAIKDDKKKNTLEKAILHELFHLFYADFKTIIDEVVTIYSKDTKKDKEFVENLLENKFEEVINSMTRVLVEDKNEV